MNLRQCFRLLSEVGSKTAMCAVVVVLHCKSENLFLPSIITGDETMVLYYDQRENQWARKIVWNTPKESKVPRINDIIFLGLLKEPS